MLRKIDVAIDFKKIYEFVDGLYCEDNGRPSVDPVALFKIVLIQHIYGIPSLRRTLEEVNMNLAYRWFIGYPLNEAVPHFSTVSYNFKRRFNHATVEYVFRWVLKAAAEEGYLDTEAIFVDGTHIKANANLKKQAKKAVPKQAKRYTKELYRLRKEKIERVFADAKEKHSMRYTQYRGLAQVTNLQTKKLLWLDCTSRFFYRLKAGPSSKRRALPFYSLSLAAA